MNIANELRGKMNADEFRDYILGFIFYKYLAEKMEMYANNILKPDGIKYKEIKENSEQGKEYIEAIREESLEKLIRRYLIEDRNYLDAVLVFQPTYFMVRQYQQA